MKKPLTKGLMIFVILLGLSAALSVIAGELLPLKQGHYVKKGVPCGDTHSVNIITYNGSGLNSAHIAGEITHVIHKGNVYHITQKVAENGVEVKELQHDTIIIKSRTSFSYGLGGDVYRWCSD